ncbi:zinc ribbon domain-containing protein [archaeon]|nr:zinc ribbon domain-containing protein [archaeon]
MALFGGYGVVQDLFWYSSYLLGAFGALSFGYLSVRFSYPDIRTMPWSSKLGFSFLLGLIFFVPSIALALLLAREAFFAVFPIAAFFTALAFELKTLLVPAKTINVALPVISVNPLAGVGAPSSFRRAGGQVEDEGIVKSVLKLKKGTAAPARETYCGSCGLEMRAGNEYCGKCGAKL